MKCAQCDSPARARGLCSKHYQAAKKAETLPVEWQRDQRRSAPVRAKLEAKRKIDAATGCWEWAGRLSDGYGKVAISAGRYAFAHRIAYAEFKGPIPTGMELDHLCRNRKCFNPDHLEPVTHKENVSRGALPQMMRDKAAAQTHCYRGHLLAGENLFLQGPEKKFRVCRACRSARQRLRQRAISGASTTVKVNQMKTFVNRVAQGDLYIRRVSAIPSSAKLKSPIDGVYIVAESETHHHHVIDAAPRVRVYETADPLVSYLEVVEATDEAEAVILRHMRSFDTHAPIAIPPGTYELRRQREYSPEGWRRAQD